MLRTFRGTDLKTEQEVVIKVLVSGKEGAKGSFRAAIAIQQALSELDHSPAVLASSAEGPLPPHIVREFVPGFSLREALSQGDNVPFEVTMDILGALLDYLAAIEDRGYRHGAICPENVILTEDGEVKALDPGVAAWVLDPGGVMCDEDDPKRSFIAPGYLEPPYFEDVRGDIYGSAKVVLALLDGLRKRSPRDLQLRAERLEADVLQGALAPKADDRFGSSAKMHEVFELFSHGGGKAQATSSVWARSQPEEAPDRELAIIQDLASRLETLGHYELLGLSPTATVDAIRQSYYALIARYHPARASMAPYDTVRESLVAISNHLNEVFTVLKDPISRSAYDDRLAIKAVRESQSGGSGES